MLGTSSFPVDIANTSLPFGTNLTICMLGTRLSLILVETVRRPMIRLATDVTRTALRGLLPETRLGTTYIGM